MKSIKLIKLPFSYAVLEVRYLTNNKYGFYCTEIVLDEYLPKVIETLTKKYLWIMGMKPDDKTKILAIYQQIHPSKEGMGTKKEMFKLMENKTQEIKKNTT